jgi:hypothetical protein
MNKVAKQSKINGDKTGRAPKDNKILYNRFDNE